MARSCSASGTAGGDDEPRPSAVSLAHLLVGPDAAPPEYLTLSLTPVGIPEPRQKQPGEVTLEHINALLDYLKLSLAPSDEEEPGARDPAAADATTSNGGSLIANEASVGARARGDCEQCPATVPPKKCKLGGCVYQETAGTAPASSSPSLSLAIVIRGDDASGPSTSSTHGGDVETRSPPAMAAHTIDAVPPQAVCVRGGVSQPSKLMGSAAVEPIDAVPLRAAYFAGPPEPSWVRETLGLPVNHPLYFIATKVVENSDMNTQQSRFLIPRAIGRLRPLLSDKQRLEANMVEEEPARKKKKPTPQPSGCDGMKQRVLGKKHGGLVVHVVVNRDGHQMDAELTTWDSSHTSVLKFGKNHQRFVGMSDLKLKDMVHIWALQHRNDLYLVITAVTPPQAVQPVA